MSCENRCHCSFICTNNMLCFHAYGAPRLSWCSPSISMLSEWLRYRRHWCYRASLWSDSWSVVPTIQLFRRGELPRALFHPFERKKHKTTSASISVLSQWPGCGWHGRATTQQYVCFLESQLVSSCVRWNSRSCCQYKARCHAAAVNAILLSRKCVKFYHWPIQPRRWFDGWTFTSIK